MREDAFGVMPPQRSELLIDKPSGGTGFHHTCDKRWIIGMNGPSWPQSRHGNQVVVSFFPAMQGLAITAIISTSPDFVW